MGKHGTAKDCVEELLGSQVSFCTYRENKTKLLQRPIYPLSLHVTPFDVV